MILALPLLVFAVKIASDIRANADQTKIPKEVVVSNITPNSATISWFSDSPYSGFVNYGTSESSMTSIANDYRDAGGNTNDYSTHYVKLTNLNPSTVYYFKINSGGTEFTADAANVKFVFSTVAISDALTTPDSLIGKIEPPTEDAIVYAHASNGQSISTPISVHSLSGNFALVKSNFKNKLTGEVFDLSNSDIIISVTDKSGSRGIAQISAVENRKDITLSATADIYNPNQIFQVLYNEATVTPTVTPTIITPPPPSNNINTPTPTTPPTDSNFITNTSQFVESKVSYGQEISDTYVPYNIFISNVSTITFTVNWLTKQPATGEVMYKKSSGSDQIARDIRDSAGSQSRYTHSVTITQNDFNGGDKVLFFIISNGNKYGINLSSSESNRFVFELPQALNSPPTPSTINGKTNIAYIASSNTSNRDLLISGRFTLNGSSIWTSTVPSSSVNSNWSLNSSVLNTSLSDYFDNTDSTFNYEINGEFNSKKTGSTSSFSNIIEENLVTGLSITNIEHNTNIPVFNVLRGTAMPSSAFTLNINNSTSTVNSNSLGMWEVTLNNPGAGSYDVAATAQTEVTGLRFTVTTDGQVPPPLPDTSIQNWQLIIIGGLFIVAGLFLRTRINYNS